jgi:hypothetical protein
MTEPSKHKHAGRRIATPEAPATPAAKQPGGARIKPPEQVRRNRPSRLAWARTTRGQVAIAVGVLALALVVRFAVGGGDDKNANQTPVGAARTTYGTDWKTADGHSYEITVSPIAELVNASSDHGCVAAPAPGKTNLRFTVRIDNKGSDPAPVPGVRFAANVKASGAIMAGVSFEKASRHIDLSPLRNLRDCTGSAQITGDGETIGPKSSVTYSGLIGGVKTPVGGGLALIVRYTQADASAPGGSGTADVVVQYPDMSSLS